MSFSYREDNRAGRLLDVLTDEAAGIRVIVSRLGAELVSLARRNTDGDWVGFLHRDNDLTKPEQGWGNHATVMGYFLHRLKDGRSVYRGREISGGTHSFLRTKTFERAMGDRSRGELTYRIDHNDFTAAEYPLNVSLDLTYRIEGESVRVIFHFQNHERELTSHVGFGLHPGFAASTFDSFRLEMPAGVYRRHLAPGNYLSGETEDVQFAGGEMPFAREQLPGSYILELLDVPDRTFTYFDPPSGRSVAMNFAGVPYLTLWSDGGPFLCVEPCWGLTDHHEQRAFEDKEGIQVIPAGGTLEAGFVMTLQLTK